MFLQKIFRENEEKDLRVQKLAIRLRTLQNKIERLFGFAHIVFSGKTTFDAGKYTNRFPTKEVHCVYGIRYNKYKDDIALYCKQNNIN